MLIKIFSINKLYIACRLRKKQIYCKSPQIINVSGKLSIMCFDKTGTLTENKMTIVAFWYDLLAREVVNYQRRDEVNSLGYNPRDQTFKMIQLCATLNNKTKIIKLIFIFFWALIILAQ